jgi:Sporulation and spore germination/Immunoglobulin-like domain of bacterial spore germination
MRRLALLFVLALAAAGCGDNGDTTASETSTPTRTTRTTVTQTVQWQRLQVYFLRDGQVGTAARTVTGTQAVGRAAIEELLAGPNAVESDAGLTTDVPAGTELRDLAIADGLATIDLSPSFAQGAEANISRRLAQVVYTLTQFPTVRRVAFELDGKPMQTVMDGAGIVVDRPVRRADYEELTPPILPERPAPGETVTSPLRISGTANTFEATFQVELVDSAGAVITHKTVMATSGSGTRGTFAETIRFDAEPGAAKVVFYEDSAENGQRIHIVEIPVEIAP